MLQRCEAEATDSCPWCRAEDLALVVWCGFILFGEAIYMAENLRVVNKSKSK